MPYIDTPKANQIVAIAKDYIGTTYYSFVSKLANGCGQKNDWKSLLCFYELYRLASHRVADLINDPSYQNIIVKLLSSVALTPNYSLATCNSNVIVTSGGCGCEGGSSTTGPVSGCTDSILVFHMNFGEASYANPQFIGVEALIAIREGLVMRANPLAIDGYVFDNVAGVFIPNAPISESGEDFILLYKDCSTSGTPVPPIILPDDIEFQIGVTLGPSIPLPGTTTYTNIVLANRDIRVIRNGLDQSLIGFPGGEGFTAPNGVGTFTVAPPWVDQEYVRIEIYK